MMKTEKNKENKKTVEKETGKRAMSDPEYRAFMMEAVEKMKNFKLRDEKMEPYELSRYIKEKKKLLLTVERENRCFIFMYKQGGDFWEMGDASMLIYVNHPAKQLGRKVIIRSDDAKDVNGREIATRKRWRFGRVRVSNMESLSYGLKRIGYKTVLDNSEFKAYLSPVTFTPEEMMHMKYAREHQMDRFYKMVMGMEKIPRIVNMAHSIDRQVVNAVNNLTVARRRMVGYYGADRVERMMLRSVEVARSQKKGDEGSQELSDYIAEMKVITEELLCWLVRVMKYDLFTGSQICNLGTEIRAMQDALIVLEGRPQKKSKNPPSDTITEEDLDRAIKSRKIENKLEPDEEALSKNAG